MAHSIRNQKLQGTAYDKRSQRSIYNRLQGWYYFTALSVLVMFVFRNVFYVVLALQCIVCVMIRKVAIRNFRDGLFNLAIRTEPKVFVKGSMYVIKPLCVLRSDKATTNALMCVLRRGQGSGGEDGG